MSQSAKPLPPVRKSITVHVPPKRAFDAFTKEMTHWWPPEYTPFPREAIVIEPKRGGRWFEKGTEGSEGNTGKVLDWQAPDRVLLAWQVDANGSSIRTRFASSPKAPTPPGSSWNTEIWSAMATVRTRFAPPSTRPTAGTAPSPPM